MPVRFRDWGTSDSPIFETTLAECHRTKVAAALAGGALDLDVRLCYDWLFLRPQQPRCPRWSNCWFLHPRRSALAQMATKFCCANPEQPSLCSGARRGGVGPCPYAHGPLELDVPADFLDSYVIERSATEMDVTVLLTSHKTCDVTLPSCALLDTRGLRTGGATALCVAQYCDRYRECALLHVHPAMWTHGGWFQLGVLLHAGYNRQTNVRIWLRAVLARASALVTAIERWWSGGAAAAVAPAPGVGDSDDAARATVVSTASDGGDDQLQRAIDASSGDDAAPSRRAALRALLALPTRETVAFKPLGKPVAENMRTLADELLAKWRPSSRWRADIEQWLRSGELVFRVGVHEAGDRLAGGYVSHPSLVVSNDGATASVYVGLRTDDGTEVAIKALSKEAEGGMSDAELERAFKAEVGALKLRGAVAGVVRYFGTHVQSLEDPFTSATIVRRHIMFELMEGTIADLVAMWQADGAVLGTLAHLHACQYIVSCVVETLNDLNNNVVDGNVIAHRDIKPQNVLVDRMQQVRLVDFGVSKQIAQHLDQKTLTVGGSTLFYCSPEAIARKPFAHRTSDLYSLGLVLHYLVTGDTPWVLGRAHECRWPPLADRHADGSRWRAHSYACAASFRDIVLHPDADTRTTCLGTRRISSCSRIRFSGARVRQWTFLSRWRRCRSSWYGTGQSFLRSISFLTQRGPAYFLVRFRRAHCCGWRATVASTSHRRGGLCDSHAIATYTPKLRNLPTDCFSTNRSFSISTPISCQLCGAL